MFFLASAESSRFTNLPSAREETLLAHDHVTHLSSSALCIYLQRDQELRPYSSTPSGRWEACPATPRAVIAREEIKKLSEARRERDSAMEKRVRQAELRYPIRLSRLNHNKKTRSGIHREPFRSPSVTNIFSRICHFVLHNPEE